MRKRTKSVIIAAVAALGIATAGISWAWFTENATANATGGAGADMQPLTTSDISYVYENGQNGLYPNRWADMKITVANPAQNNIDVTVTSVVPATTNPKNVTAATPNNSANRTYCEGLLIQAATPAFTAQSGNLILAPGDSVVLVVDNAVALDASADNRCQNMAFDTNWTVVSQNN